MAPIVPPSVITTTPTPPETSSTPSPNTSKKPLPKLVPISLLQSSRSSPPCRFNELPRLTFRFIPNRLTPHLLPLTPSSTFSRRAKVDDIANQLQPPTASPVVVFKEEHLATQSCSQSPSKLSLFSGNTSFQPPLPSSGPKIPAEPIQSKCKSPNEPKPTQQFKNPFEETPEEARAWMRKLQQVMDEVATEFSEKNRLEREERERTKKISKTNKNDKKNKKK